MVRLGFELEATGWWAQTKPRTIAAAQNKLFVQTSVTRKNRKMSIKVAQKWFHKKNDRFRYFYKNCLRMLEIWAN